MHIFKLIIGSGLMLSATTIMATQELIIGSDRGAAEWDEGYPIGNGRIGLHSLGGFPVDDWYLNEHSIWARDDFSYPKNTAETLKEIRTLATAGKYIEADRLFEQKLVSNIWRPGTYEFAGMARLKHLESEKPTVLRNTLDLSTGLSRSEAHFSDGTVILREAIALRKRDVIALRIYSTRPTGLHFRLRLTHPRDPVKVEGNTLILSGEAENDGTGFQSELWIQPANDTTKVSVVDGAFELIGGQEAILFFGAATDYNHEQPDLRLKQWRAKTGVAIGAAQQEDWTTLLAEGQAEMKAYMERFAIELGTAAKETTELTTAERIKRYATGKADPDLEELLFQFGRYCLVASNVESGLPNNLQGIWSEGLKAPWSGDYHLNINLQMNYWPAEPTGLSELHQPMLDLVTAMQPSGEKLASVLGYEGFCTGHAINAWMKTWFSGNRALWSASVMNGAWITAHMMEHYRYTGDREFLAEQAWPALQENVRFILSWLQRDEEAGEWITGPGTSPENQFTYLVGTNRVTASISCGSTHDQMMAWESLSDLIEAANELGIDNELVKRTRAVLPELAEGRIGQDGRLQEWRKPFGEAMPGHRHVSHAYGFFPGRQYNVIEHPEMVEAIQKSLDYRMAHGGGYTGWSRAWLINIEACLMRPEAAYSNIRTLLSKLINPNLFDMHPPFQIDGNFGYTSAICTMLLQSHIQLDSGERVLMLLPALPAAWPKGEVRGLHVRGGAVVDLKWSPDEITARITAERPGTYQVRYRDRILPLELKEKDKGAVVTISGLKDGNVRSASIADF